MLCCRVLQLMVARLLIQHSVDGQWPFRLFMSVAKVFSDYLNEYNPDKSPQVLAPLCHHSVYERSSEDPLNE